MPSVLRRYTIHNAGSRPDSHDLVGCQIAQNDNNTYDFIAPGQGVVASTLNTPPIQFTFANFKGWDWNIRVRSSTPTIMTGVWSNNDPNNVSPADDGDSWTASGTGVGEPGEDEARAASAK